MDSNSTPSIIDYIGRFEAAKETAKEFIAPLDDRTFRRKPSADAWCIGECFSHLVETGNKYSNNIEEGLKETGASHPVPKDPMRLRIHMRWFVNYLEPPISFKAPSPATFKPPEYAGLNKDVVLQNFSDLQDNLIQQLTRAKEMNIDLSKIKVPNPVTSLIKMTVAECMAITEAHQRRHFEQAENTLQEVLHLK